MSGAWHYIIEPTDEEMVYEIVERETNREKAVEHLTCEPERVHKIRMHPAPKGPKFKPDDNGRRYMAVRAIYPVGKTIDFDEQYRPRR